MALINQLNATTEYYWLNTEPVDILNKASALLWKLMGNAIVKDNWLVKPREIVDGGLMVKVPLEYENSNSGGYGATTIINQSKKDIIDAARFGWGGLYSSNTLNLNDKIQNTGDEAIIDLTKQYMQSIIKTARIKMAKDILLAASVGLAADGAPHINGLGDLFNENTAVEYGAIATIAMPNWKANVITESAPISYAVMQEIFRAPDMGDFAGMLPDFIVTTPKLRDGYKLSLHPQQRYTDTDMVKAGWPNIWHDSAPIVADGGVPDGCLYALNLNFLSLRSHTEFNFTTPRWVSKEVMGQPDIMTADTRWIGNLYCSNRRMHVLRKNLKEPE